MNFLSSAVAAFDGLRPFGLIAGVEPMRLINITLTLALATTGPLMRHYAVLKYSHIAAASAYVLKFFADQLRIWNRSISLRLSYV